MESDNRDIKQLKKLSDVIVDLAAVAIAVADPTAGVTAAKLRSETKNLLKVIIEMDGDDRLVTDSMYFTPTKFEAQFGNSTLVEFSKTYARDTLFTSFSYRFNFRLLR